MKKTILLIIASSVIISCNKLNKMDLKVIEDIQLGTKMEGYQKNLDSLNIKKGSFYTIPLLESVEELREYSIGIPYTEIFDFKEFHHNKNNFHIYGLLLPQIERENNLVVGLNVCLGHTSNALGIQNNNIFDVTKKTRIQTFTQNVPTNFLEKLEIILNNKYGDASVRDIEDISFFLIDGNQINSKNHSTKKGKKTIWETKYFRIILFKGFEDKMITYDIFDKNYEFSNQDIEHLGATEFYTQKFPYLRYELKEEVVQELLKDEKIKI